MVNQAWAEEGIAILDCAKKDVKVRVILGKDTVFPKELIESTSRDEIKEVGDLIEHRIIESVPISIYISDKETGVMFPNLKGEVDMNTILLSSDSEFRDWCEDIFKEYWSQGQIFNVDKIKTV